MPKEDVWVWLLDLQGLVLQLCTASLLQRRIILKEAQKGVNNKLESVKMWKRAFL